MALSSDKSAMLYTPERHETLQLIAWDEAHVRAATEHIVRDTEARYSPDRCWPLHPRDVDGDEGPARAATGLDFGACGVIWASRH